MKAMGVLAVLIGAFEALNALAEAWAGGMAAGGRWLSTVILAVVAGALLIGGGLALLRPVRRASGWAAAAALACLASVVAIRLVQPWMSTAALLLGIGFPCALLLYLAVVLRPGSSTSGGV